MTLGKLNLGSLNLGNLSPTPSKPDAIQQKPTPADITAECADELSDQAKQIAKQEAKLKERMDFDNDRTYYFSIVFRSTEERNAFLASKKIKLRSDDYVFYEDIKDKI